MTGAVDEGKLASVVKTEVAGVMNVVVSPTNELRSVETSLLYSGVGMDDDSATNAIVEDAGVNLLDFGVGIADLDSISAVEDSTVRIVEVATDVNSIGAVEDSTASTLVLVKIEVAMSVLEIPTGASLDDTST